MQEISNESNALIDEMDVVGTLFEETGTTSVPESSVTVDTPLREYLVAVNRTMDRFQTRANELAGSSIDSPKQTRKGLSRITYGLFMLGLVMSVAVNLLLVSVHATLIQLALCNFGTMIIFVLAGICLLNDVSTRILGEGTDPIALNHRIRSITENVDQLSRVTFDWNKQIEGLEQQKQAAELSVMQLQEREQQLATIVNTHEEELQQTRIESETSSSELAKLNSELTKLSSQIAATLWDAELARNAKDNLEIALRTTKDLTDKRQVELASCEEALAMKMQEINSLDSQRKHLEELVTTLEQNVIDMEMSAKSISSELDEKVARLAEQSIVVETRLSQQMIIEEAIESANQRLKALCECERRHTELNSILVAIGLGRNQVDELESNRIELDALVGDLNKTKLDLHNAIELLQSEFEEQQESVQDLSGRIASLRTEEGRILDSLAIKNRELESAEKDFDGKAILIDELVEMIEAIKHDESLVSRRLAASKQELELLQIELVEQRDLVEQKSDLILKLVADELTIQERIAAKGDVLEITTSRETYQSEIADYDAIIQLKLLEVEELEGSCINVRDEIQSLGIDVAELTSLIEQLREESEVKARSIEEQSSTIRQLENSENSVREQIVISESILSTTKAEANLSQFELSNVHDALEELRLLFSEVQAEFEHKSGQCRLLESQLDLKLGEIHDLEASIATLHSREETLQVLCTDAEGRLNVLAEKSEGLANHLESLTSNLAKLENQRMDSESSLERIQSLLQEKSICVDSLDASIHEARIKLTSLEDENAQADEVAKSKSKLLDSLNEQILDLNKAIAEREEIQNQYVSFQEDLQILQSEIADLLSKRDEGVEENKRINASIQLGRVKAEETDRAIQKSIDELLAAERKLNQTKESQCLLQAEHHQATTALNNTQKRIFILEADISNKTQEIQELSIKTQAGRNKLEELSISTTSHEELLRDIISRVALAKEELTSSSAEISRLDTLKQEVHRLELAVDQLHQVSESATEKIADLERERHMREDQLDALTAEVKRYELSIAKSETSLNDTNNKCETAKSILVDFEARKSIARKELDQLEQSLVKSRLTSETIASEIASIEKSRLNAKTELDRYAAEVAEAQAVCRQWQEYGEMLRRTNQELETSQKTLDRQVQTLQIERKNAEYALEQNMSAGKIAMAHRDKLLSELEGLESKRRDLAHSEDALKHSLESKRALLKELDAEIDQSRMNSDNASLEFEQLRMKCKSEKSLLAELVSQHDELLREISNRSELHEQQTRRCDDLKTQEQSLLMKITQLKEKINVYQDQEKVYAEKRVEWEEMASAYNRKVVEFDGLKLSISTNRDQLKTQSEELEKCQLQLSNQERFLIESLGKLSECKLQFALEQSRQKQMLTDLNNDILAKQSEIKTIEGMRLGAREQLEKATLQINASSEELSRTKDELEVLQAQCNTLEKAKQMMEDEIGVLIERKSQLDARQQELVREIQNSERNQQSVASQNDEAQRRQHELQERELGLVESCRMVDSELQSKQEELADIDRQISAGEQRVIETLQAITLIGQQRELAQHRLDADLESTSTTKSSLDSLEARHLDCESSVLHLAAELDRMISSRDQLTEELRILDLSRRNQISDIELRSQELEKVTTHSIATYTLNDSVARQPEIVVDSNVLHTGTTSGEPQSDDSLKIDDSWSEFTLTDSPAELHNDVDNDFGIQTLAEIQELSRSISEAQKESGNVTQNDVWESMFREV